MHIDNVDPHGQIDKPRPKPKPLYRGEARIKSGRYAGKKPEWVFLHYPDWAQWMVEHKQGPLPQAFRRIIDRFGEKPFLAPCDDLVYTGTRANHRGAIRSLAIAKGLSTPVTEMAALDFFYGDGVEE